jgi:hypothetical protein
MSSSHRHFVQVYDIDHRTLTGNVAAYVFEGLSNGETAIIIATPGLNDGLVNHLRRIGGQPDAAVSEGRLVLLDAAETLGRILRDGTPDRERFLVTIGSAIGRAAARSSGVRCYGEMVGVLWTEGRRDAAIALERLWNELLATDDFQLYCGYPIGIFSDAFQLGEMDPIFCSHTHIVPAGENDDALYAAIDRAMGEVLGSRTDGIRSLMKPNYRPSWPMLPKAEAAILWLRNNIPEEAEAILRRACEWYAASGTSARAV